MFGGSIPFCSHHLTNSIDILNAIYRTVYSSVDKQLFIMIISSLAIPVLAQMRLLITLLFVHDDQFSDTSASQIGNSKCKFRLSFIN